MSFTDWMNSKVGKLDWLDIGCVKLAVFAFALLIAKFWPEILNLSWYWYVIIFVLATIRPLYKAYFK